MPRSERNPAMTQLSHKEIFKSSLIWSMTRNSIKVKEKVVNVVSSATMNKAEVMVHLWSL